MAERIRAALEAAKNNGGEPKSARALAGALLPEDLPADELAREREKKRRLVARWLADENAPDDDHAARLARIFGTNPDHFKNGRVLRQTAIEELRQGQESLRRRMERLERRIDELG